MTIGKRTEMNDGTTSRGERAALRAVGTTAVATGVAVAVRGTRAIPGGAPVSPSVDSVLRFYAVWWAASGLVAWRLASSPRPDQAARRAVCAATFLGGLARVAAARQTGRPHPLFRVLTVLELWIPPVLAGWTALRARRHMRCVRPTRAAARAWRTNRVCGLARMRLAEGPTVGSWEQCALP